MLKQLLRYWHVFQHMMHADFLTLKKQVLDIIINTIVWCSTVTVSTAFIMPAFGVSQGYSLIMVGGVLASAISFAIYPHAVNLSNDLHNNRKIGFLTTLPIPWWLVCIKTVWSFLMAQLIISACAIPVVSLFIFSSLNFFAISWLLFASMFMLCNIFCACFTLFIATIIPNAPLGATVAWMRYVFPLWYLGGFQFTWHGLARIAPLFAKINLLNPYTYMMEGMRSAMFPQGEHISSSICACMLILFSVGFFTLGSYRIKKQLDAV
jgi:hypothetical protein